ncbi:hypothetical protein KY363_02160 [Candidatus Woesearchaeota archaeon]|nr:hypothetical protein [Candidatus Woesearchaeota archaeon]
MEPKKENNTLDDIVKEGNGGSRVYILSEVGYDTAYFNETAYANLLEVMAKDRDITGVLVDGAVTRLDRPEFLNEALTYWESSEEDCRQASKDVKNRDQYHTMKDIQLGIVERRLRELRQKVPEGRIVLSLDSDDIQYTASAMLNEMLVREQMRLGEEIESLKNTRRNQKDRRKEFQQQYSRIETVKGKSKERTALKSKIDTCTKKIDGVEDEIQDLYAEQKLYREKKVRPAHQFFTREFIEQMFGEYRSMCERLGIELITGGEVIDFNGLRVDYAHSRNKTWNVVKSRDRQLVKSVHGKLEDLAERGIDVVLESGHCGIGYKQLQKVKDVPAETNFTNQSAYSPETCDRHVTIVMALPFEDRAAIGEYVRGKKVVRMSGGKPMNTRKIAATDRYCNDSVTGITVLTKDGAGLVGTEWIQYENFRDGSVLKQPDVGSIIAASSDEHIASPEDNPMARLGWTELYREMLTHQSTWRGRPAIARGYLNGGDVAEANSRKWDHRYHHKRSPEEVMQENLRLLAGFSADSIDSIVRMAMKMTNDSMAGSVESMSVIMDRVADYLEQFVDATLEHSSLKWAVATTTGNHADNVLRDLGLRESDFLRQRLKAKGVQAYEVGKPGYFGTDRDAARVMLGGYSNARIYQIEDYGLDTDGKPLFGPVNLVVQHDPKGSGMSGIIGAGRNTGADLALAAHTHDNRMKLYNTGDNTFGVAYKLATLQGVAPTEKYYAYSVPRTQAAHALVMPMPGDFTEKAIPASYLQRLGLAAIERKAKEALDGRKKG